MKHPKFIIKTGNDGKYYFNLTAKNGQIILSSQGYKTKSGCTNGIDSVQTNAQDENRFRVSQAKNGQFYFTLAAGNGEVIGKSEMYTTKSAMENGIKSVMANAAEAKADELVV